jgi:hypothetical protein
MRAYVKHSNTPESDAMDRVWHIVETSNGNVEVLATDPMDAIKIVTSNVTSNKEKSC